MKVDIRATVASKLRAVMESRGVSVDGLAESSGVSRATLFRALAGTHELTLSNAVAICNTLQTSLTHLTKERDSDDVGSIEEGRGKTGHRRKH